MRIRLPDDFSVKRFEGFLMTGARYLSEAGLAVALVYITPSQLNLSKNSHFVEINEVIPIVLVLATYVALRYKGKLLRMFLETLTLIVVWMVGIANNQLENVTVSLLLSGSPNAPLVIVTTVLLFVIGDLLFVSNAFTIWAKKHSAKVSSSSRP